MHDLHIGVWLLWTKYWTPFNHEKAINQAIWNI